ncbi:dioxygenase [Roseibium aquae]|uniref:Dioxygenase n=1 Tax=Roseibium aquae TaxID=1323746 RepID=A0A916TDE7_9HYPH|nr:class III extradiol ring-cleavage dioxygenase [Roseibium aquae]GGB40800.1 dioxygenase [Roseibium aquae]
MTDAARSLPPLFLAHGAPSLAVDDTPAHRFLRSLGSMRSRVNGLVILSPHWETGTLRMSAPGPLRTIHDFRGFSKELYAIEYPATADPGLVDAVRSRLNAAGYDAAEDPDWGLDHGAWVPLSLAFPDPGCPVVALSLPAGSTPETMYELGLTLAPLADQGVLLIGSGSTTHNLRQLLPQGSAVADWVADFDSWLDTGLQQGDIGYFADLAAAPGFRMAHPTEEHLLPLFFAFGAGGAGAKPDILHRSYEYGTLSMTYYRFAA